MRRTTFFICLLVAMTACAPTFSAPPGMPPALAEQARYQCERDASLIQLRFYDGLALWSDVTTRNALLRQCFKAAGFTEEE